MILDKVTFTGADDSVSPEDLIAISKAYPFVEWGILFSKSHAGTPRFPSAEWVTDLSNKWMGDMPDEPPMALAAHLCGGWMRDLIRHGDWSFRTRHLGRTWSMFERVQLNFHAEVQHATAAFVSAMGDVPTKQVIFQCDGVNDEIVQDWCTSGLGVPLFDTSGGAGVLPGRWPPAWQGVYCGYAGGLGPDNVVEQVIGPILAAAAGENRVWIDMERRVRSDDDRQFDLDKVRAVLRDIEFQVELSARASEHEGLHE